MAQENAVPKKKWILPLAALGIVFGDIGTSPLYAFEAALGTAGKVDAETLLGLSSLVIWYLLLIVTFKYLFLVMRADYDGEGGIFALLALLRRAGLKAAQNGWIAVAVLFGAALLYGDGTITPAISVLSAVEGLESINPALSSAVIPITVVILVALFSIQRFGTGRLGLVFGFVMVVWFAAIGLAGLVSIIQSPGIFAAINPWCAIRYLQAHGPTALVVFGSVVLAVTGAEALYADLGHFGKPAISKAWNFVALPGLVLNYLGQAALVLRDPAQATNANLFFELCPHAGRPLFVLLATAATVIASQALISGVFSLTSQAIDLGYLPRFRVVYTSSEERGQIYMPAINIILGLVCIVLVVTFKTGDALANAYGLAVTGTMMVTSIAFGMVVYHVWKKPLVQALALTGFLLCVEVPLFAACTSKFFDGGWFPVLIGIGILGLMSCYRHGSNVVHRKMKDLSMAPEAFHKVLIDGSTPRIPGTLVFPVRGGSVREASVIAMEYRRRTGVLNTQIVAMRLEARWDRASGSVCNVDVKSTGHGVWIIFAQHGYMAEPDAPEILRLASIETKGELRFEPEATFYVFSRIVVPVGKSNILEAFPRRVFDYLTRNTRLWRNYLSVPNGHVSEFIWLMDA